MRPSRHPASSSRVLAAGARALAAGASAFVVLAAMALAAGASPPVRRADGSLDCGPLPEPVQVVLPGIEGLPEQLALEVAAPGDEATPSKLLWTTPEPEGGLRRGEAATEEFLRGFVEVTLWAHADAAGLPELKAPWWAEPYGFPRRESRELEDLGEVEVIRLFDRHPDVPSEHVEPWIALRWKRGGTAYQLLSRGLTAEEALRLAAGVREGATRASRPAAFEPNEEEKAVLTKALSADVGATLHALDLAGFCVVGFEDERGAALERGEAAAIRGLTLAGPRHVVLYAERR